MPLISDGTSNKKQAQEELAPILKELGRRVAETRIKFRWTQQEFGDLMEIHRVYISNFEAGKISPTLLTLQKMCTALGCTLTELFAMIEE